MILVVLTAMSVLAALQGSVVVPLVANVPSIFGVSVAAASWVVTATLLGGAVLAPIVSRLADMFGKRRVIVVTLLLVAGGALMVAISDNFLVTVAGRAIQGSAAALIPVAMSVVKDVFPPRRVGFGVAVLSGTMSLGAALGLPLAGLLYSLWGWSGLFWLSAALASFLAMISRLVLPREAAFRGSRFDLIGAVLLLLVIAPILVVVSQAFDWGWGSPWILGSIALALVSTGLWVPWCLRREKPMVDLRVAMSRPVALTNIASFMLSAGMLASLYLASQQLAVPSEVPGGMGLSSSEVGALLAIPASTMLVLTPLTGVLLSRWGGRPVITAGAIIMSLAYIGRIHLDDSPSDIVLGATLVSIGTAFALSAQPMIIMGVVPRDQAASANGLNSLFRTFGTAASISIIAAFTTVTATVVGGAAFPGTQTFHTAFLVFSILTAIAAVLTLAIPRAGDIESALAKR